MAHIVVPWAFLLLSSAFANQTFYIRQSNKGVFRSAFVARATAHSLRLEAICGAYLCSQEPVWTLRAESASDFPPTNSSTAKGKVVTFEKLTPNTQYSVKAETEYNSVEMTAITCSSKAPRVEELRVVSSGLGWLEVRWRQPKEQCRSEMKYLLSYGPMGPQFVVHPLPPVGPLNHAGPVDHTGPLRRTGHLGHTGVFEDRAPLEPEESSVMPTIVHWPTGPLRPPARHANKLPPAKEVKMIRDRAGTLHPVHPCPTWPKDFCVWLTDHVEPKEMHLIQVRAQRVDGAAAEQSAPSVVEAAAQAYTAPGRNPSFGWSVSGVGWRRPGAARDRGRGFCAMWSGVAIGTAVATLLAAFAMAVFTMHRIEGMRRSTLTKEERHLEAEAILKMLS